MQEISEAAATSAGVHCHPIPGLEDMTAHSSAHHAATDSPDPRSLAHATPPSDNQVAVLVTRLSYEPERPGESSNS